MVIHLMTPGMSSGTGLDILLVFFLHIPRNSGSPLCYFSLHSFRHAMWRDIFIITPPRRNISAGQMATAQ